MSKQHRPQLDWTPDAKLPTRFKAWNAEIEDEILLFEGEDKPSKYICNFVKVCSGKRGKAILAELNVYKQDKDYEIPNHPIFDLSGSANDTTHPFIWLKQKNIFGAVPLEPPSVVIKAFGDQPVRNLGCKVLFLHLGKQILQKKFQVCDVRKNPIIGRDLSAEMGYITFPPITEPHLSSRPTTQKIYTISTKAETTENITDVKRPVVQKQTKNQRLNTQQDDSREAMLSAKHTSQEYYNSHAKEREQLSELQQVWYKKDRVAHWQRGSVVQVADTPKSYVVQDDSGARY
ncbi:hypothetical protein CAPTEDRAFT_185402 [Capitella teleta]|uniref:Uncharacterized protein n=1 Tax=Capitella teleta TaxID=283909 RepID=R7TGZ5_CAPTE|nr:hypothetical protein CAPTEDRAFT_185402 [Capitella teleta]|eukprot:ELT90831.1 hypothetical protein CAPTEDRAFT_185402 [Capitella teleta]